MRMVSKASMPGAELGSQPAGYGPGSDDPRTARLDEPPGDAGTIADHVQPA